MVLVVFVVVESIVGFPNSILRKLDYNDLTVGQYLLAVFFSDSL